MKIQIDTNLKVIRLEESINLDEFYKGIKRLFPNDLWKQFKLETNVINNWTNPIVIKEYPVYPILNPLPYPNPLQPPYQPTWITCQTGTHMEGGLADVRTTYSLKEGVFNIDCQIQN